MYVFKFREDPVEIPVYGPGWSKDRARQARRELHLEIQRRRRLARKAGTPVRLDGFVICRG
jgi:hypothetical protein